MKQGLVVFAFGSPGTIGSNKLLREEMFWLLRTDYDSEIKKVYTQTALGITTPMFNNAEVVTIPQPDEHQHPPTLRIAKWAVDTAVSDDLDQLLILAAEPHLPRCIRDTKYAAKASSDITVNYWGHVGLHPSDKWFCQDSDQPRTRTWFNWWSREVILMSMPLWLYAKVAG